MKVNRTFSRRFLLAASAYRRQVKERPGLDFSLEALKAQYDHETHGAQCPDPKKNGFTLGKWTMDVTIAAMKEDHSNGLFTKHELMAGSPYLVRQRVKKFTARSPFWR